MIKKIPIAELTVGMYIRGFEREGSEKIISFENNIRIKDYEDIRIFKSYGYSYAHVVAGEGFAKPPVRVRPAAEHDEPGIVPAPAGVDADIEPPAGVSGTVEVIDDVAEVVYGAEKPAKEKDPVGFLDEIATAKEIRSEAEGLVREFLRDATAGAEIKTDKVHSTVDKMVDSVFRNRDALLSLARLKSFDDYTFAHCVNVCILSITMGRSLGLNKPALNDLGAGAILHDIGKVFIPENVLKKPGPLTAEEYEVIKTHTFKGADLLYLSNEIRGDSVFVTLHHHEKYDGTGYPSGAQGEDIHMYARIASVADVYDAMTSNRVYQKRLTQHEAMQKMYVMRQAHFDPQLVERLIKCLGIYPIGVFVELNTGEMAVVTKPGHVSPLRPSVLVLLDRRKKPCASPYEIDLAQDPSRSIMASMDPDNMDISLTNVP